MRQRITTRPTHHPPTPTWTPDPPRHPPVTPRHPLTPAPAIPAQVKSGAIAFLKTEYTYLCFFVVALAITLFGLFYATDTPTVAAAISLSFVFGASLSAGAGWCAQHSSLPIPPFYS